MELSKIGKKNLNEIAIQISNFLQRSWIRNLTRSSSEAWQLTLSSCKRETTATVMYLTFSMAAVITLLTSSLIFEFNEYQLPLRIYFEFIPFAGSSVNWIINYFYQIFVSMFPSTFFYLFVTLNLIIVNHSCWEADITILLVNQLDKILNDEDDREAAKILRQILVTKKLRKIVDMTYRMIDYHDRVQHLMKVNFLIDLSFSSFLLCMCLFTIKTGLFTALLLPTVVLQIFLSCWVGDRVIDRYQELAASLYNMKWYLMNPKQQKDFQLILLRVQAMKGFNGIFKVVSLETFQRVGQI